MKDTLKHTSKVTGLVHDQLITWTSGLMRDSGLESVDVFGRFPPEGTVRSHLVLFPYRVGPEPKNLENSRGASILTHDPFPSDKVGRVPTPWRNLGKQMLDAVALIFPETLSIDTPRRPNIMPFPRVKDLPKELGEWYAAEDPDEADPFVVTDDDERYARPPALHWRPGVSVWAHYIAVAGDAGRGVSDRTSDAPPLSLAALAVLTVGIQVDRVLEVELPPMPYDDRLRGYLTAMIDALGGMKKRPEAQRLCEELTETRAALDATATYKFGIVPVHDLNMHEFALLTQALQRPLQAVLNFRLAFSLGDGPVFQPSTVVSMRHARMAKRR